MKATLLINFSFDWGVDAFIHLMAYSLVISDWTIKTLSLISAQRTALLCNCRDAGELPDMAGKA